MKLLLGCFVTLAVLVPLAASRAQGTLTITFDGSPIIPTNTGDHVQSYSESGMWFEPIPGTDGFVRWGGGDPRRPENGTAYLQLTIGDSLMFGFTGGAPFNMDSVDLAGYSTVVPDVTAEFVGYRSDGSTVTTNIPTSGIIFQTYYFGPQWSDLTRVEVPDFGSLDNLVVSVPEPGTGALIAAGALIFQLYKIRKQKEL